MLSVLHFTVASAEEQRFVADGRTALALLATKPGWRDGRLARAADDPGQWVLVTSWEGVGQYRRAVGAHDVRALLTPFLARAQDRPSTFEVVVALDGEGTEHLRLP
ncbi:MAG TPA: antibiotic biosynthesis monooxygenase [Actinomycetes bacterium]|nr:antibiotic biosynthesis monooxygenase [Actinomycetes bacterium]